MKLLMLSISLVVFSITVMAVDELSYTIPMQEKAASTFYIPGFIDGYGATEFMVDTGSGYTTINEQTLSVLKANGKAVYAKQLIGILADGTEKIVSVYRISSMSLGGKCEILNVEAAIFPGKTRQILGLNALRKIGQFTFSFEPPSLSMEQCEHV